jgi:hypothetical protein
MQVAALLAASVTVVRRSAVSYAYVVVLPFWSLAYVRRKSYVKIVLTTNNRIQGKEKAKHPQTTAEQNDGFILSFT